MPYSELQAVILAAGTGSRIASVAKGQPKCLLKVGTRSLLRHHLANLSAINVERVLVVAGHGAEQVMAETCHHGVVQFNADYAETNSLYSLWLARKWITGGVLVINGDLLAAPGIYQRLAKTRGNALAYDSSSGTQEEEMKVCFESDRLHAISKDMDPDLAHGESLGILKFDAPGAKHFLAEVDRLVQQGQRKVWVTAAVGGIARHVAVRGLDISGLPWTEIDFPEDLARARQAIWPAIAGLHPGLNGTHTAPPQIASAHGIPKLAS